MSIEFGATLEKKDGAILFEGQKVSSIAAALNSDEVGYMLCGSEIFPLSTPDHQPIDISSTVLAGMKDNTIPICAYALKDGVRRPTGLILSFE